MNEHLNTTLKVVATLATGFAANYVMTLSAAPGYSGTALAVGVLLTAFGFMFAQFAMQIVMLPMAVVSLVLRLIRGNKIKPQTERSNDRLDFFGRALFVAAYGLVSAVTGIFIGAIDDGMGWLAASALFGTMGILLAVLVPEDVIWAFDEGDTLSGSPTAAGKADIERARQEGNPSVLFADKVAKNIIKVIVEKPSGDDDKR